MSFITQLAGQGDIICSFYTAIMSIPAQILVHIASSLRDATPVYGHIH